MGLRDTYDLNKELSSGRGVIVYTARRKDGRPPQPQVVKIIRPLDDKAASASDDPRIAAFLNSAQILKQAQQAYSSNLAPIFEVGVDEIGAWYATKYYPGSLARVIAHRIQLDLEDFYHLFHSIIRGLWEFKRFAARSHGNLKPSNVLLDGRGRVRRRKVLLIDPQYEGNNETTREISDLRALGAIVWHTALTTVHPPQWPIEESDLEWKAFFGAAAIKWIHIYNQLLNPKLTLHNLDLDKLRSQLPTLPGMVRARQTARSTAPVTLPLALALGFGSYMRFSPVPDNWPTMHRWARLVGNQRVLWDDLRKDYNAWFGGLVAAANDANKNPEPWTDDEYLRDHVLLPIVRANLYLQELNLKDNTNPPSHQAAHIQQAAELMVGIKVALERWPKLVDLNRAASDFKQRDWVRPAGKLEEAAGAVQFRPEMYKAVWRARLNLIFDDAEDLKRCESKWNVILEFADNQRPKLTAAKLLDDADARFNPALASAGDLESLAEQLGGAVDAVQKYLSTGISPATIEEFATAQIGFSPVINREWLKQRDATVAVLAGAKGQAATFARLKGIYEMSMYLASTNYLPQPEMNGTTVLRLMRDEAESQREAFLARLVHQNAAYWQRGFPANFENSSKVLALRQEYLNWEQGYQALARSLDQLPASLITGDPEQALNLYQVCQAAPDFGRLAKDPALQSVFAEVKVIEDLQTNSVSDELVSFATNSQPDISFAAAVAAWERLHTAELKPWPANLAQVRQEIAAQANMSAGIDRTRTVNPNQAEILENKLGQGRNALIRDIFRTLTDRDITVAVSSLREQFGANAFGDVSDPAMQFNFLLHDFRSTNDFARMTLLQLKEARARLIAAVNSLGSSLVGKPELRSLTAIQKLDFDQPSSAEKTPAQLPFWSRQERPASVVYSWTDQNHQLEFVLVFPDDAPPAYLCTTELPVGLVVDWLTEHKTNAADFIPWLKRDPQDDPRRGVRTWDAELDAPELRPIRLSDSWQSGTWTTFWEGNEPKEFKPAFGQPTDESPINYLPPSASKFIAEALGFRLPTPAEWLAAYRMDNDRNGNLRDLTWKRQWEYIRHLHPGYEGELPWPNQDVFEPFKTPFESDSTWRTNYDDGMLWFAPVNLRLGQHDNNPFIHLVGNVAEYLYDPTGGGMYYVIGGSALSSPSVVVDHPYPVDPRFASKGFSDVGVRLALDATIPPSERFRWLVAHLGYLVNE